MRANRVQLSTLLGSALMSVVLAANATAAPLSWSTPQVLREHDSLWAIDAAYSGQSIAVLWEEDRSGRLRLKTSADGGASFSPVVRFTNANWARAAICGQTVYVVFVTWASTDNWIVNLATGTAGTNAFGVMRIADGPANKSPDVACTDGRVFVSWLHFRPGGARFRLTSARTASELAFSAPVTFGVDTSGGASGARLAATSDSLYAAFPLDDGHMYLKRWSIGAAPDYALTTHAKQVIGTGSTRNQTYGPVIGADGNTVAVAWGKCAGTVVRVSRDRGKTWEPKQNLVWFGCDAVVEGGTMPVEVAAANRSVAVTYESAAIPDFQASILALSGPGSATFDRTTLGKHQYHFIGFVRQGVNVWLADVYSNNRASSVRFRHEL